MATSYIFLSILVLALGPKWRKCHFHQFQQFPVQYTLGSVTQNVLSPKNLMPTKNSYLIQTSGYITPAINSSLTLLYGEVINFFFISPNITYDINSSLDASVIGQFFFMNNNNEIPTNTGVVSNNSVNTINGYYARIKWSF